MFYIFSPWRVGPCCCRCRCFVVVVEDAVLSLSSLGVKWTCHVRSAFNTLYPPVPAVFCYIILVKQGLLDKHGRANAKTPVEWTSGYQEHSTVKVKSEKGATEANGSGEETPSKGTPSKEALSPPLTPLTPAGAEEEESGGEEPKKKKKKKEKKDKKVSSISRKF